MTDEDESGEEGGRSSERSVDGHAVYENVDAGYLYIEVDGDIISASTIEELRAELSSRQPRPR